MTIMRRGLSIEINTRQVSNMAKRGVISLLMSRSLKYRNHELSNLCAWIDPPLDCNQVCIFYNANGVVPLGYITWAYLADDVQARWINDPEATLHESEWNEEGVLWIMDFLAIPGACEDIIEYINKSMFLSHNSAFYLKRHDDGRIKKITQWRRKQDGKFSVTPCRSVFERPFVVLCGT